MSILQGDIVLKKVVYPQSQSKLRLKWGSIDTFSAIMLQSLYMYVHQMIKLVHKHNSEPSAN